MFARLRRPEALSATTSYAKKRMIWQTEPMVFTNRLNRISHWDVNVTDLERSRSWYEASTTLRVVARTKASQSFPSFGIGSGSFTGYLLKDANLPRGVPMIPLVEWQNPTPVGRPYRSQANVGWYRICPILEDIEAARGSVIALERKERCSVRILRPIEDWSGKPVVLSYGP